MNFKSENLADLISKSDNLVGTLLLSNPQLRLCSIFFLTTPFFLAKKTHTIIIADKTDSTNAVAAEVGGSPAR